MKDLKEKTFFLTDQYSNVKSGPGRFANYLNECNIVDFDILTDDIKFDSGGIKRIVIKNKLESLPFYYIYKAYIYNKHLNKLLKKNGQYNIVINTALLGLFIGKSKNIRIITFINDPRHVNLFAEFLLMCRVYSLRKIVSLIIGRIFERIVVSKTDILVVNSEYLKKCILKNYSLKNTKIKILHKFVDLDLFKPKKRINFPIKNFLFLKNDYKRGNLELIVEALSRVSYSDSINLVIAGIDNKNFNTIREYFIKYKFGGTYKIYGHLEKREVHNIFQKSDCLIMPSKQESFGVVFLEAMASKVLIITRSVGGIAEILNKKDYAFFVRKDSVIETVEILERIYVNRDEVIKKVESAFERVSHFSKNKLKERFSKLVND